MRPKMSEAVTRCHTSENVKLKVLRQRSKAKFGGGATLVCDERDLILVSSGYV